MKSTAEVIAELLIDEAVVTEVADADDWPIYVSHLPATPANAVCVFDTSGKLDGRIMATGEQIEHPGIQIRIRGPVYTDVWGKVKEVTAALDAVKRVSVAFASDEAYLVENVSRSGAAIYLGLEEEGSRRDHHFSINAMVTLREE